MAATVHGFLRIAAGKYFWCGRRCFVLRHVSKCGAGRGGRGRGLRIVHPVLTYQPPALILMQHGLELFSPPPKGGRSVSGRILPTFCALRMGGLFGV